MYKKIIAIIIILIVGYGVWLFFSENQNPVSPVLPPPAEQAVDFGGLGQDESFPDTPVTVTNEMILSEFQTYRTEGNTGSFASINNRGQMQSFTSFSQITTAIPPDRFLGALEVNTPTLVTDVMHPRLWSVYQCEAGDDARVFTVMLTEYESSPLRDVYAELERSLAAWESTFVYDVAPLLFPEVDREVFRGPWQFVDTTNFETRRHTRVPVAGEQREIGYYFIANELFIGNDLDCLEEVRSLLFDLSA